MTTTALSTPEDLLAVASAALEQGDPEAALELCRELLTERPDHDEARLLEAEAFRDLQDLERAEESYRHLLAAHPTHVDGLAGMARVLIDQYRLEEAAACASHAIRRDPGHPEAHHVRAMLRELRGDLAGALRDHTRAWVGSSRYPLPKPRDHAALRALLADAARLSNDEAFTHWVTTLPLAIEPAPTPETCQAYDPPASPVELVGHFGAEDAALPAHHPASSPVSPAPPILLYALNLARYPWSEEILLRALHETILVPARRWYARSFAEA